MKINWRVYWFFRNMSALVLCYPCYIVHIPYIMIQELVNELWHALKCNGSMTIDYPWQWNWKWKGGR